MIGQTLEKTRNRSKNRIIRAFKTKRTAIEIPKATLKESKPTQPELPRFMKPVQNDPVVDAMRTLDMDRNGLLEGLPMTVDVAKCILNIDVGERSRQRTHDTQDGFLL